jgi:hypothetical protein
MAVDSQRAGSVITCPNCHRNLRVPSGKGRGKEIASAAPTQTTRPCPRCGRSIPIDAQMCPECKAILTEDAPPQAPGAATPMATARPVAGTAIQYGGSRASWWSNLSTGAKVGILLGGVGFVAAVVLILSLAILPSWRSQRMNRARQEAQAALEKGRELETGGRFQEAFDEYYAGLARGEPLRESPHAADQEILQKLETRVNGLQYIVPKPRVRAELQWRARNQAELNAAQQDIVNTYQSYRQRLLAVTSAAEAAIEGAESQGDKAAFGRQVNLTMDAFIRLANTTKPYQRATFSFDMLVEAVRELAKAHEHWDANRDWYLGKSAERIGYIKELVNQPPGTPMGDKIRSSR